MSQQDNEIMRGVKRLAQKECANYADGFCLPGDRPCHVLNPTYKTIHDGAITCDSILTEYDEQHITVRVQDPDSNTLDERFEELNDFLQDCASDLEAVIGSLQDLKNTFELYDFSDASPEPKIEGTDMKEVPF